MFSHEFIHHIYRHPDFHFACFPNPHPRRWPNLCDLAENNASYNPPTFKGYNLTLMLSKLDISSKSRKTCSNSASNWIFLWGACMQRLKYGLKLRFSWTWSSPVSILRFLLMFNIYIYIDRQRLAIYKPYEDSIPLHSSNRTNMLRVGEINVQQIHHPPWKKVLNGSFSLWISHNASHKNTLHDTCQTADQV